ncbi:hypothetical protein NDU88_009003 [Pleurodeles waltl]|uniref:Uncharacterized protein n=1 Tax=Pleurodeles waltl TaxID=8319 RepID=A0AAV7PTS2_PLEWA|nr:hypothetical protein NDU88_009003 [Pleurodeles waltl]
MLVKWRPTQGKEKYRTTVGALQSWSISHTLTDPLRIKNKERVNRAGVVQEFIICDGLSRKAGRMRCGLFSLQLTTEEVYNEDQATYCNQHCQRFNVKLTVLWIINCFKKSKQIVTCACLTYLSFGLLRLTQPVYDNSSLVF